MHGRRRDLTLDAMIAGVYGLLLVAYSAVRVDGRLTFNLLGWGYSLPLVYVLLVLMRRSAPLIVLSAVILLDLIAVGTRQMSDGTAIAILMGTLVFQRGRILGLLGLAMTFGATISSIFVLGRTMSGAAALCLFCVLGYFGGLLAHGNVLRILRWRRLAAENLKLRREQAQSKAREAVTDDIHDILTHTLAITARLADAAAVYSRTDAGRTIALANEIASTSRRGLSEVRGIIQKRDGTAGASCNLASLLAAAREAGLPIEAEVQGTPGNSVVDQLVGRTIQESVTNIMKHADPTQVVIYVDYGDGPRPGEVYIRNDGVKDTAAKPGHGLQSLDRRWREVGGAFSSGLSEGDSAWVIRVTLPSSSSRTGAPRSAKFQPNG